MIVVVIQPIRLYAIVVLSMSHSHRAPGWGKGAGSTL